MLFVNHCHVFPESPDLPAQLGVVGTLDRLVDVMKRCGIDRAVAFAPFEEWGWSSAFGGDPNEWLADELPSYPELVGFACINPKSPDAVERLERAWRRGLLGVKLHPPIQRFRPNDRSLFRFYGKAEELGMVLDFHTGIHGWRLTEYQPLLLDDVAYEFPNLKIIMEHVGGALFYNQAVAVMLDKRNVYAGVATVLDENAVSWFLGAEKIEELVKLIGEDRLVYGTDFPYNGWERISKDIEMIKNLDISESAKKKILGENLARILKIM